LPGDREAADALTPTPGRIVIDRGAHRAAVARAKAGLIHDPVADARWAPPSGFRPSSFGLQRNRARLRRSQLSGGSLRRNGLGP
jgi:hypothetical protein